MRAFRLREILLKASLLAAPACCLVDTIETPVHESRFAPREMFAAEIDACIDDDAACEALCDAAIRPFGWESCEITSTSPNGVMVTGSWTDSEPCAAGRRPRGFVEPARCSATAGDWLARTATLEAASVTAFARLVRSLVRLGAPRPLIADARRAIADELRHTRTVARLAHRLGGAPTAPIIEDRTEPSLVELARENAVEGQVAETFGALVATCQARTAADPHVRRAFVRIARDETRHAQLAHRLAPWLDARLSRSARASIAESRRRATSAIRGEFGLSPDARATLGIPAPTRLRTAAAQLFAA
jgi:hypothetical protein